MQMAKAEEADGGNVALYFLIHNASTVSFLIEARAMGFEKWVTMICEGR